MSWHTLGGPSPDHWVYVRPTAPGCLKNSLSAAGPVIRSQVSLPPREDTAVGADKRVSKAPSVGGHGGGIEGSAVSSVAGQVDVGGEGVSAPGGAVKGDARRGGRIDADPFALFRAKGVSFQV